MSITYLIERKTRFSLAEQVVFPFGTENDEQQVKIARKKVFREDMIVVLKIMIVFLEIMEVWKRL